MKSLPGSSAGAELATVSGRHSGAIVAARSAAAKRRSTKAAWAGGVCWGQSPWRERALAVSERGLSPKHLDTGTCPSHRRSRGPPPWWRPTALVSDGTRVWTASAFRASLISSSKALNLLGISPCQCFGGSCTSTCSYLAATLRDSPVMRELTRSLFVPRLCIRRTLPIMFRVIKSSPCCQKSTTEQVLHVAQSWVDTNN